LIAVGAVGKRQDPRALEVQVVIIGRAGDRSVQVESAASTHREDVVVKEEREPTIDQVETKIEAVNPSAVVENLRVAPQGDRIAAESVAKTEEIDLRDRQVWDVVRGLAIGNGRQLVKCQGHVYFARLRDPPEAPVRGIRP